MAPSPPPAAAVLPPSYWSIEPETPTASPSPSAVSSRLTDIPAANENTTTQPVPSAPYASLPRLPQGQDTYPVKNDSPLKAQAELKNIYETPPPLYEPICRVCKFTENKSKNPLIAPCKCTSQQRYVHEQCMQSTINKTNPDKKGVHYTICSTCQYTYNTKRIWYGNLIGSKVASAITVLYLTALMIFVLGFPVMAIFRPNNHRSYWEHHFLFGTIATGVSSFITMLIISIVRCGRSTSRVLGKSPSNSCFGPWWVSGHDCSGGSGRNGCMILLAVTAIIGLLWMTIGATSELYSVLQKYQHRWQHRVFNIQTDSLCDDCIV